MTTEIQNNRFNNSVDNTSLSSLRRQRTIDANNQQSSFYEELLNLPFFDATEPPAPPIPPANDSSSKPADGVEASDKKEGEGEDSANDEPVAPVAVVQVAPKNFEEVPLHHEDHSDRPRVEATTKDESKEHSSDKHDRSSVNATAKGTDQKKQTANTDGSQTQVAQQQDGAGIEQLTAPKQESQTPIVEAKQSDLAKSKGTDTTLQQTNKLSDDSLSGKSAEAKPVVNADTNETKVATDTAPKVVEAKERHQHTESKRSNRDFQDDGKQSVRLDSDNDGQPVVNRRAVRLAERKEQSREEGGRSEDESLERVGNDSKDIFATSFQSDVASKTTDVISSVDASAANGATTSSVTAIQDAATAVAAAAAAAGAVTPTSDLTASMDKKAGAEIAVNATSASSNSASNPAAGGSSVTANLATSAKATEATRGASGSPLTPYQQSKLVQRVLRGIEQLSNGGGQVRLRLHPPELGALQMTLKISDGQMSAQMEVENALAKDALLSNVQTLKEKLSEQGITIDKFEVQIANTSSNGSANGSAFGNGTMSGDGNWRDQPTSRYVDQNNNRLSDENAIGREPSRAWTRTNGNLDVRV